VITVPTFELICVSIIAWNLAGFAILCYLLCRTAWLLLGLFMVYKGI
jgi:hypothetical protein